MRYNLARYTLTITPPTTASELVEAFGQSLTIGGNGSNVGSIELRRQNEMFSLKTYATGGYAVDKNLSKAGTISITLHQLSAEIQKFIKVCNVYFNGDYDGCTLTVMDENNEVASAKDCFINQAPQTFAENSGEQTWSFICGEVDFKTLD